MYIAHTSIHTHLHSKILLVSKNEAQKLIEEALGNTDIRGWRHITIVPFHDCSVQWRSDGGEQGGSAAPVRRPEGALKSCQIFF